MQKNTKVLSELLASEQASHESIFKFMKEEKEERKKFYSCQVSRILTQLDQTDKQFDVHQAAFEDLFTILSSYIKNTQVQEELKIWKIKHIDYGRVQINLRTPNSLNRISKDSQDGEEIEFGYNIEESQNKNQDKDAKNPSEDKDTKNPSEDKDAKNPNDDKDIDQKDDKDIDKKDSK